MQFFRSWKSTDRYVVPAVQFFFRYKAQFSRYRRHEPVRTDSGALSSELKNHYSDLSLNSHCQNWQRSSVVLTETPLQWPFTELALSELTAELCRLNWNTTTMTFHWTRIVRTDSGALSSSLKHHSNDLSLNSHCQNWQRSSVFT